MRNINRLCVVLCMLTLAIFLSGCDSTLIATGDAKWAPKEQVISNWWHKPGDNAAGRILVKRDVGFSSHCATRVWINGTPIVDLETGEKYELSLPAGEYVLETDYSGGGPCGGWSSFRTGATIAVVKDQLKVFRILNTDSHTLHILPTTF